MKSYIRRTGATLLLGIFLLPGVYAVGSTPDTSVVVLWLP